MVYRGRTKWKVLPYFGFWVGYIKLFIGEWNRRWKLRVHGLEYLPESPTWRLRVLPQPKYNCTMYNQVVTMLGSRGGHSSETRNPQLCKYNSPKPQTLNKLYVGCDYLEPSSGTPASPGFARFYLEEAWGV